MILVTGAAGKTGRAVIAALATRRAAVRAFVHRPEQAEIVERLGAWETVVGDMADRESMSQAVDGVRAVYHICPNMHPGEVALGQLAMEVARAAGVTHFVYHSVLHPQTEAMPHHWRKLRVEERLFESGLPFTILQPAAYMQNVSAYWERIVREGVYPVPYAVDAPLSLVDLEDVAQAAAIVLTEEGHEGAVYELAGPEALTPRDVAQEVGRQLGRPVRAEAVPLETWQRNARAAGLGEEAVDALLKMFRYYDRYGLVGNPRVLSWLLGRPPTAFADFVARLV